MSRRDYRVWPKGKIHEAVTVEGVDAEEAAVRYLHYECRDHEVAYRQREELVAAPVNEPERTEEFNVGREVRVSYDLHAGAHDYLVWREGDTASQHVVSARLTNTAAELFVERLDGPTPPPDGHVWVCVAEAATPESFCRIRVTRFSRVGYATDLGADL